MRRPKGVDDGVAGTKTEKSRLLIGPPTAHISLFRLSLDVHFLGQESRAGILLFVRGRGIIVTQTQSCIARQNSGSKQQWLPQPTSPVSSNRR